MSDTVFYSWQPDLPNATNRGFIEDALKVAAKAIHRDETIEVEPVIDRDTAGVPGSPDIAGTIFEKIDQAKVFVCDVSIVNQDAVYPDSESTKRPRLTPNPNVLLELGYAIKSLGSGRVLMVMNTAFGSINDLPFDLRLKRVIAYCMPLDASERSPERKMLSGRLEAELRAVFRTLPSETEAPEFQEEIKPSLSDAAKELLIEASNDPNTHIVIFSTAGGTTIQTSTKVLAEPPDLRSIARLKAALRQLVEFDLLELSMTNVEIYTLTDEGHSMADALKFRIANG